MLSITSFDVCGYCLVRTPDCIWVSTIHFKVLLKDSGVLHYSIHFHWEQNSPRAWYYQHHASQLVQCSSVPLGTLAKHCVSALMSNNICCSWGLLLCNTQYRCWKCYFSLECLQTHLLSGWRNKIVTYCLVLWTQGSCVCANCISRKFIMMFCAVNVPVFSQAMFSFFFAFGWKRVPQGTFSPRVLWWFMVLNLFACKFSSFSDNPVLSQLSGFCTIDSKNILRFLAWDITHHVTPALSLTRIGLNNNYTSGVGQDFKHV